MNVEQRTEKKMHTKKTIGQKSALLLYDLVAEIPYKKQKQLHSCSHFFKMTKIHAIHSRCFSQDSERHGNYFSVDPQGTGTSKGGGGGVWNFLVQRDSLLSAVGLKR